MPYGEVVLLRMGALFGAGLFLGLGAATDLAGPGVVWAVALAGSLALAGGFAFVALDRSGIPDEDTVTGIPWTHHGIGGLLAWIFAAGRMAAVAAVAVMAAGYLLPHAPLSVVRAIASGLIVIFVALALAGVRIPPIVAGYTAALALVAAALFLGMTMPLLDTANLRPMMPRDGAGFLGAAALLFAAYVGYARPAMVTEGVFAPRKDTVRAVPTSLLMSLILFMVLAWVSVGVAGVLLSGHTLQGHRVIPNPLALVASFSSLPGLARGAVVLSAVLAACATLPAFLGDLSRTITALGVRRLLPPAVSASWSATPWAALLLGGFGSLVLCVVVSPFSLLAFSAGMALLHQAAAHGHLVMSPGPPLLRALNALALAVCAVLVFFLPFGTPLAIGWSILAGLFLLAVSHLWKNR